MWTDNDREMRTSRKKDPISVADVIVGVDAGADVSENQPVQADESDLTRDPQHIGLGLQGDDDTGSRGDESSTFDHPSDGGPG